MLSKNIGFSLLLLPVFNFPCGAMNQYDVLPQRPERAAIAIVSPARHEDQPQFLQPVTDSHSQHNSSARGDGDGYSSVGSWSEDEDKNQFGGIFTGTSFVIEEPKGGRLLYPTRPLTTTLQNTEDNDDSQSFASQSTLYSRSNSRWKRPALAFVGLTIVAGVIGTAVYKYVSGDTPSLEAIKDPLFYTSTLHPRPVEDDFQCVQGYGFINESVPAYPTLYDCVAGVLQYIGAAAMDAPCTPGTLYLTKNRGDGHRDGLWCEPNGILNGTWWRQ